MATDSLGDVALLDVIRPPKGFETDAAWLGAYSVDLVAFVACLIALAGEGSDGDMPPTAVATAITRLTGRVRVVAQAGRVAVPRSGAKALRMADRWVREVPFDGRTASWHPKVALVRQTGQGGVRWVLWLGSRNLTRDVSWDLGLGLVGYTSEQPAPLPGLESLARVLAEHADLADWSSDVLSEELSRVRWDAANEHVAVRAVLVHGDGTPSELPPCPPGASHLLAVSPFIDRGTLKAFRAWGPPEATRRLATTSEALRDIASKNTKPLAGLQLRSMEPAVHESAEEPEDDEQYEEPHRGLHAKALLAWAENSDRATLWLGSANLTRRAWLDGKNVELTAQLDISRELAEQLWHFTDSSLFVAEHDYLESLAGQSGDEPSPLEHLRNEIAGWDPGPTLELSADCLRLTWSRPLPQLQGCLARVGLLGAATVDWQAGVQTVALPRPDLRDWTELLHVTLQLDDDTQDFLIRGTWVDGIPETRDHHAISSLLGARAFLRWLVASLQGVPFNDGDTWPPKTKDSREKGHRGHGRLELAVPSLEAVLRTWTRNPERLQSIDRRVLQLAQHVRRAEEDAEHPDVEALRTLNEFEAQWQVLREGLWGATA